MKATLLLYTSLLFFTARSAAAPLDTLGRQRVKLDTLARLPGQLDALNTPLAQLASTATFDDVRHARLKDSIVSRFNRRDFKGMYALADKSFQEGISEHDFVAFAESYSILGKITSSSLLTRGAETHQYRLQCANKSMQLTLGATDAERFHSFGLDLYRLPAERTRAHFFSDNPLKNGLDSIVQKAVTNYMSNKNVSGLSVGVIKDGQRYSYNFGEVEKGSNRRTNNNTIYEIGSMAKPFTGILLAQAVLDGKLTLDDDIRKYLKGNYPNLQFKGSPIKIVHLANLTSRIPSTPPPDKTGINPLDEGFSGKVDDKMLSKMLSAIELDTLPGTKRAYSNLAVCVLGRILENVYGLTYEQLLKKYIADPYQMTQTKVTLSKSELAHYAQGYSMDGTAVPYWSNEFVSPAGGIRSSVADMLLFMQEQLNTNNKAAQLSHQVTFGTEKNGKGLLWGIDRTRAKNHLRWSHDGSTNGFSSIIWILPEIQAGLVILTNNADIYDESFQSEIFKTIYPYLSSAK
jgi:CubicO group peptidase (beta-lactamase class C family)